MRNGGCEGRRVALKEELIEGALTNARGTGDDYGCGCCGDLEIVTCVFGKVFRRGEWQWRVGEYLEPWCMHG